MNKWLLIAACALASIKNDNVVAGGMAFDDMITIHTVQAKTPKQQPLDLTRFGQAVGDKRLVVLDELTHGEGNVFDLKRQVIEYLHQHKGFDLLLLESGLYDVSRIWANDKQSIKSQAPGNIFYMYANSPAVQQLFDYIDNQRKNERPLYMAGFDGRLSGELSTTQLLAELKTYVATHYPKYHQSFDWDAYQQYSQAILKRNSKMLTDLDQLHRASYLLQAYGLADLMASERVRGQGYQSSIFWAQLVKGISRLGEQIWELRRSDENDLVMADNIQWLLDNVYPNKKAIVWGHFVHVNKLGFGPHRYANVGSELAQRYPGQVYITHFGGAKGRYTDFITMKQKVVPPLNSNSLEQRLLKQGLNIGFIDAQDVNFDHVDAPSTTLWGPDYVTTLPLLQWKKRWDGMFFLEQVSPVDYRSP